MRTAARIAVAIKLGGAEIFWTVVVVGFLTFALACWWLLRCFAGLYRKKKLSDQTLTLDSLFFVFAVEQGIALDPSGAHVYVGVAAFVAYKVVVEIGLRSLRPRGYLNQSPPMLLYLRILALGDRGQKLFDSFAKLWRRIGPIAMIAGPDLIRSTVEPHEFLEFLGGKMSRRFVSDAADMTRRVAELDTQPDPDGRYRVNQFFCHEDTWKMTMSALARRSAAVLMDLRSFSAQNRGCLFELGQLVGLVDLSRVVLLIDSTTDRKLLEQTLQELWNMVPAESPNLRTPGVSVRLFLEQRAKTPPVSLLFQELLSRSTVKIAA